MLCHIRHECRMNIQFFISLFVLNTNYFFSTDFLHSFYWYIYYNRLWINANSNWNEFLCSKQCSLSYLWFGTCNDCPMCSFRAHHSTQTIQKLSVLCVFEEYLLFTQKHNQLFWKHNSCNGKQSFPLIDYQNNSHDFFGQQVPDSVTDLCLH